VVKRQSLLLAFDMLTVFVGNTANVVGFCFASLKKWTDGSIYVGLFYMKNVLGKR
jgi:hypothetical protein